MKISILGSTGSIGTQAIEVAKKHNFKISALSANSNADILEKQAREWKPLSVAVFNEEKAKYTKRCFCFFQMHAIC